jgi:LemA protein
LHERLTRRYNLIPALVNAVQSSGGEAIGKLPAVSIAKNQAAVAFSPTDLARAETALSRAIQDVLATAAIEPSLSNSAAFVQIQQQIVLNAKQIEQARDRYNEKVEALNASISSFPQVLTAKAIGLNHQPGFET